MKQVQYIVTCLICLGLFGCAPMFDYDKDTRIAQAEQRGEFRIGMELNEVVGIVGRYPDTKLDGFIVETKSEGVYKTWIPGGGRQGDKWVPFKYRTYVFQFKDDKLIKWSCR